MKKIAVMLAFLLCFANIFSYISSSVDEKESMFILPSSLQIIGESAFEGTAVKIVVLSDSVTTIEKRAFADTFQLETVRLPSSVKYIDECAFESASEPVIQGKADSYAAQWAQAHGYAFSAQSDTAALIERIGKLILGEFFVSSFFGFCPPSMMIQRKRMVEMIRSMRPQDRPELYPIDYRFP